MEYRTLGKTGLHVSALGFGCGNVGGLMIRGESSERERAFQSMAKGPLSSEALSQLAILWGELAG